MKLQETKIEYVGSIDTGGTNYPTVRKGWITPSITNEQLRQFTGQYVKVKITVEVLEVYEGKVTKKGIVRGDKIDKGEI